MDATCNPYLALAVVLAAGLDGIKNVKDDEVIPPVYDNIFTLTREQREAQGIPNLPENLKDALKEMTRDPLIYSVCGEHTYNKYLEAKQKEWDKYRSLITPWEVEMYL